MRCLIADAAELGYGEYRTHIAYHDQVANTYNWNNNALMKLNETIKDALDPNGIVGSLCLRLAPPSYLSLTTTLCYTDATWSLRYLAQVLPRSRMGAGRSQPTEGRSPERWQALASPLPLSLSSILGLVLQSQSSVHQAEALKAPNG